MNKWNENEAYVALYVTIAMLAAITGADGRALNASRTSNSSDTSDQDLMRGTDFLPIVITGLSAIILALWHLGDKCKFQHHERIGNMLLREYNSDYFVKIIGLSSTGDYTISMPEGAPLDIRLNQAHKIITRGDFNDAKYNGMFKESTHGTSDRVSVLTAVNKETVCPIYRRANERKLTNFKDSMVELHTDTSDTDKDILTAIANLYSHKRELKAGYQSQSGHIVVPVGVYMMLEYARKNEAYKTVLLQANDLKHSDIAGCYYALFCSSFPERSYTYTFSDAYPQREAPFESDEAASLLSSCNHTLN